MEERHSEMRLEDACNLLGWVVLILGTIGAFVIANAFGVSDVGIYHSRIERDWGTTFAWFFGTMIPVCAMSLQLLAAGKILETQNKIKEKLNIE